MTDEKIARINFLAHKQRDSALSQAELEEQSALRREYLEEIRAQIIGALGPLPEKKDKN